MGQNQLIDQYNVCWPNMHLLSNMLPFAKIDHFGYRIAYHQGEGSSLLNGRHGPLHGVQACDSQLPQLDVFCVKGELLAELPVPINTEDKEVAAAMTQSLCQSESETSGSASSRSPPPPLRPPATASSTRAQWKGPATTFWPGAAT